MPPVEHSSAERCWTRASLLNIPVWGVLALFLTMQLLALLAIGTWRAEAESWADGLLGGVALAQIVLCAAAGGWAPAPVAVRMPAAALAALLCAAVIGQGSGMFGPSNDVIWVLFLCGSLGLCLVTQGMIWAATIFGIRLVDLYGEPAAPPVILYRFGLRDLMLVTAGVALVLGALRFLWPKPPPILWSVGNNILLLFFLTQFISKLLLANALITVLHVPRAWWRQGLLLTLFFALISLIETYAYYRLDPVGAVSFWGRATWCASEDAAFVAWLLLGVLALRLCGVALRRIGKQPH